MDELESMNQVRSILDNSVVEHNSRPPLRWIANLAGSIASKNMLKLSYMEDDGEDKGFKYKYYGWLWDTFWPLYQKYGTFYKLDFDMDGPGWDDYDENGVPYWEKFGVVDPDYYPWDFEDEETGDAFRIVR
jgi:hypothetical protein